MGHISQEGIVGRVGYASKNKVLPYQDPFLVSMAVELFVLVDPAAPHTHEVHVGRQDIVEQFIVILARLLGSENLPRDIVGSLREDGSAVHLKIKRAAMLIRFLH